MTSELRYGNWIRLRLLALLALGTLALGALSLLPFGPVYRLLVAALFVIALISFLFPLYAYLMFSQRGGRLQEKIYDLIISSLGPVPPGRLLDIGAGNGVLTVKLAQAHPQAEVVGVDYWGPDWEYSQSVCEQNAQAGQVTGRVHFQKGDAARLDFPDAAFAGAVSNLTFHEVRSVADKRAVLREALRVIEPGGAFAFVDYFAEPRHYGGAAAFASYLHSLNLAQVDYVPLSRRLALPLPLRHPKIFGPVGLVWGCK